MNVIDLGALNKVKVISTDEWGNIWAQNINQIDLME